MTFMPFLSENWRDILQYTWQHIELSFLSIFIAILIGVPLGILIGHYKALAKFVLGFANVVQAIPSLALLGFAIPFLGIGAAPAICMVLIYSLLPIVKNTYTGLSNINSQTIEAARGIGMSNTQILLIVEVPLALPVIMAGVRISAVTAIGLITIAAFVGAGGLGYLVFAGIQRVNNNLILAGAIPAMILALTVDYILGKVEILVTPAALRKGVYEMTPKQAAKIKLIRRLILAAVIVLLLLARVVPLVQNMIHQNDRSVTVASKNYTEQIILGNLLADLVEANTDIKVNRQLNLGGSTVVFTAMREGIIDVYAEYTGVAYMNILEMSGSTDPDDVYHTVAEAFQNNYHITWLKPFGYNNTYTIAVRADTAEKYRLKTISDLAKVSSEMIFSPTIEFVSRPDGLPNLGKLYRLYFKDVKPMDGSLRYAALENDSSQVIDAFSTDGLLKKFNLTILADDKAFFPPYYAAPIIRNETLEKYPELEGVLDILAGKINESVMIELNYQVDVLKRSPEEVAETFLRENGYIK